MERSNGAVYAADSTLSCDGTTTSAELVISNKNITDNVTAGGIAYGSSNVSGTICNAESYALTLYSTTGLVGGTAIGNTTNNVATANMAENTWGYSWNEVSVSDENAKYSSLAGTPILENIGLNSDGNRSFSKKLSFAAKFGENAEGGHYTADVTLALTATPKEVIGFGVGENKITAMQAMTPEVCASVSIGDTGVLEDVRDGSRYSVAKLDDNNCWMTRNLELTKEGIIAKGGENNSTKLTSILSNVAEDSVFTMPNSIQTLSPEDPKDFSGQIDYNNIAQIYNGGYKNANWKPGYGAYYNWYAATAGAGNTGFTGGDVSSDICPKGWKLPTENEYRNLLNVAEIGNNAAGSEKIKGSPYYFVNSGGIWGTTTVNAGSSGRYWSGTARTVSAAIRLITYDGAYVRLDNGGGDDRMYGYSVRCVAVSAEPEKTWETMTEMQEMTPEICSKTPANTEKTLTDSRDQSTYTVKKIGDKCWMTQNLRIVNKKITPADSNVTSDYTIPASALWSDTAATTNKAYYNNNITYGAYYTYYTATAGTNPGSGAASSDICPKGWRLPTQAEYNTAAGSYASYDFVKAGHIFYGSFIDVNNGGYYWSSTANSSGYANFYTYLGSSSSSAELSGEKESGLSVRCVAQ